MITKEELKKEVDKLPDNLLDEVYRLLKNLSSNQAPSSKEWIVRNFNGKLDKMDIRSIAYK
jgi:hypothetical protein